MVKKLFLRESESEFGEKESSVSTALASKGRSGGHLTENGNLTLEKSLAHRGEHWIILPGL